jgi:hypothetical protein
MAHTQDRVAYPNDTDYGRNAVTGWVGWVFFAGVMLFTGGAVNLIEGIVALVRDNYFLVRPSGLVVSVNYTVWGWALLLSGVLLLFAGYGVMVGQMWARVTAVILAVVNVVVNMVFIPAYPIWAIIIIVIDVFVIYALAVHGGETKRIKS